MDISDDRGAEGPPPRPSPRRRQRESYVIQGHATEYGAYRAAPRMPFLAGALGVVVGAALALAAVWLVAGRPSLREYVSRQPADTSALSARLDRLEAALAAPKAETRVDPIPQTQPAHDAPADARAIAALALQRNLDAGRPLGADADALRRLGVSPATLAPLAHFAQSPAASPAALASAFVAVEPQMRAARGVAPNVLGEVAGLVRVRKLGEAPVAESDLAKVKAALDAGDLDAALAAYEALPAPAREAGRAWADQVAARRDADRAAQALLGAALTELGSGR